MRSFRFKKNGGGVETAVQGNRLFSIIPTTTGQFLAKVVEKEGRRQEFIASDVLGTRDEAVEWLKRHRVAK
jgi:hypothetical protein